MNRVCVNASSQYDVLIGSDLLSHIGEFICKVHKPSAAVIVSDTNVWPIWGDKLKDSLEQAGIKTLHYLFPAGESSKNICTYIDILNFLAENHVTRSDLLVALGGGVVGDISGFVAATFLRGLAYVQVPTSLLAMVDSSVGGKTAVDLPSGKNLVGAFKQPKLVVCDIDTLNTLPRDQFLDGCAEIIKYGVLYSEQIFADLTESGPSFDREKIIAQCVAMKALVVNNDEFDMGERQKLNLGHTFGHGIEVESDFQISHGRAVAIGMSIVSKAAANNGLCSWQTHQQIVAILNQFELPVGTSYSPETLYRAALSDKKRLGATVNLIVPRKIGKCDIIPYSIETLESFIKAGL